MILRSGCRQALLAAALLVFPVFSSGAPVQERALSPDGERRSRALALYFRAATLESELRLREALEAFEQLLEQDPSNADIAARASALAAALNEQDRGLKICEAALAAAPDSLPMQLVLAQYLHRYAPEGAEEIWAQRALELTNAAVKNQPGDVAAIELLTDIHLAAEEPEKARAVVDRALLLPETDAAYRLTLADLASRLWPAEPGVEGFVPRKRVDAAYDVALAAAPRDVAVAERVANYHIEARNFRRALEILQPFAAKEPERLMLREKVARLQRIVGGKAAALESMRSLVLADPNEARTQRLLSELLVEAGESEQAVRHLERAVLLDGGGIDDYLELAVQLSDEFEPPQPERALALLKRGLEQIPGSPRLTYMRAIVLGNLGRFEEALAAYLATEELARVGLPDLLDVDFYFGAGSMAERAGRHDDAAKQFERAVELVPADQPERAAPALNFHGYMLLQLDRDIDRAGRMIRSAVDLDPGNPAYLDSLGWYYFKKTLFRKALIELRRAALLLGDDVDAEVLGHIAETYSSLGEEEKAAEYRKKAAALGD